MHQVDMPINWHFLRLSIIKQRQFLSPWEKQIRKFFEVRQADEMSNGQK